MPGDLEPRRVVEDVRLEHQLVVGLGLDEDDVDARVALLPLARHLVQALIGEQLERLIGDLREAHVRDAPDLRPQQRRDLAREVVHVGHERVHDHDEPRARLDGDVEVRGRGDAAVDQLAVADLHRLVDHRQRRRRAHGERDRDVVPALGAQHQPLARVEVGRGEVELVVQQPEVVRAVGIGQDRPHVLLDPGPGVQAGGQRLGERDRQVDGAERAQAARQRPRDAREVERQLHALEQELAVVGPQQHAQVDVAERRRRLVVDDAHHLLRRHAVGGQRRHQRAGARADVDVELVDGAVDGQEVEGPQRPDLVDGAREAAATEHERGLGPGLAAARLAGAGSRAAPLPRG